MNIDNEVFSRLAKIAQDKGLDIAGGKVRRSSSRFCFGVEHGDYNGTELFGVGTDRFIWLAYKPNGTGKFRFYSDNFPDDGILEFSASSIAPAKSLPDSWGRFAHGTACILQKKGCHL